MEKGHREDVALAPTVEAASASADRESRRRRQQRAASQSETQESDEQRLALHERMLAAMQTGDVQSLLGDGPTSATQMNKAEFLAQLRLAVEGAANQELGALGSAAGCPYIESYFGKYSAQPAAAAELLLRRWVPNASSAASARELIPLVVARVRTGVHEWTKTGVLPGDLAAADPQVAALVPVAKAKQTQAAAAIGADNASGATASDGSNAAAPTSLHTMEAELGAGQALDGATASRVGAASAANDVKIHTGPVAAAKAAQHNAVAFAVGNNVVMGAGAPAPGTLLGDALLAHELAHTAQQRDAARDPQARKRAIGSEDTDAEHDADRAAAQGLAGSGQDPALAGLAAIGDRFGDVMKTGLQLQRCQIADANASIDRAAYYQTYKLQIAQTAADHLRTLPFRIAEPTVKWVSAPDLFSQVIAEGVLKSDIDALVRPEAIGSLIDSSRLMDTLNLGPDAPAGASVGLQGSTGPNKYFGSVGIEVGNALARRTNESLLREVPRYAEAVSRLESAQAKPHADDIAVSHPMDPIVISALLATKLVVDVAAFKRAHPASATAFAPAAKTSRNIVWEPAADKGAGSQWRRVIEPIDVTEEELAAAWLGSPTEAFRIVSAYPLYGIRPDRRGQLRNTQADNASGDPVEGLLAEGGAVADEVMLAQAATVGADSGQRATGRPAIVVLEQMHHNVQSLKTSVVEAAKRFGLHGQLGTVTARLTARVQRIAALAPVEQEIELRRWDLQTAMQAEVIRRATNGLFADGERLRIYADGFKVDLAKDAGAHGLPYEYRQILREDAEAWVGVVDVSDVAGVAEQRLAQASAHFATLDIWLLERSLGTAQYAADAAGGAQQTQADFAAGTLAPRELALRGELGVMRQTMMAGQLSGAQSDKTAQAVEDLTFESQMVLQAVQLEGSWTTLENLEGFLSRVTLQQGDLEHFAARGKKYYSQWRGIRDTFNNGVKNNDAALKQKARTDFQQLASSVEFQDFFSDVRQQLAHTQKVHLIASLVVMVAITVVSMGAGTIVSGALGGTRVAIVAATAGEAATATQVVATGLGVSRTVASVAGFVTEAAVFTGLSTAVFEKDPSIGGVITSFGKNLVLFGGMRGLARVFESLGLLGNAAKLGADASKGTKVLTHTADALAETVLMGGVGVLLTAVEAEVKAKLNGRPVTSDEYEQMLISTLLQTIAMVIVARAGAPMLAKLQSSAALGSTRLRIKAHTEQTLAHAQHVQGLRDSGKLTAETVTAAATRDRILIEEELALAQEVLQSAKHDPAAVDAALQKAGLSRAELQHHVDGMTAQLPTVRGMEVMFRLRELGPGELGCPRAHVKDVLAAQRALSGEAPVLEATNPATGARTWRCARAKPAQTSATSAANVDTTPVRITELMPTWALDATGQRLVHAAEASGMGETIFGFSEPAISALRDADAALLRGDDAAATAAFERSGIAAKERAALEVKVREQAQAAKARVDEAAAHAAAAKAAEAKEAATAARDTQDPAAWIQLLRARLTESERTKLDQMSTGKSAAEVRESLFKNDIDVAVSRVKAEAAKTSDAKAQKAAEAEASRIRSVQLQTLIDQHGLMKHPKVQESLQRYRNASDPDAGRVHLDAIRSEVMSEILRIELKAEFVAEHPQVEVLRDVDVYVEQPGTADDFSTTHPKRQGWTDIDNKPYIKITDIDLLVVDRSSAKAKVLHREEIKTGESTKVSKADSQLKDAAEAVSNSVKGGAPVRLRQGSVDITAQIDLASMQSSTSATVGPAGPRRYDKSTGIRTNDLNTLIKTLAELELSK